MNIIFEEISKSVHDNIFSKLGQRSLTVLLVGAGQEKSSSLRETVRKELENKKYFTWFDVYYPEDLFEELISETQFDLLTLENLLAKDVHTVAIILESSGAIAELGAFANHKNLCDRLVVIIDKKYRKKKSFIMLGPVRYLQNKTRSIVIFHNFRDPEINKLGEQIRNAIRKISKDVDVDYSVKNPIAAQHFLLAAIYITGPVKRDILTSMINSIIRKTNKNIIIVRSSLNILLRSDEVIFQDGEYMLTRVGVDRLIKTLKFEPEGYNILNLLDKLRVEVLNRTLRKQRQWQYMERAG